MRTPRRSWCLSVLAWLLLLPVLHAAKPTQEPKPPPTGLNCVFLGHSFFAPSARALPAQVKAFGIEGHVQVTGFGGGANGSPGRLWRNLPADHPARKALASGKVDLVGMTYFPGVGSELEDYRRWVDLALEHNPRTRFFLHSPWPRYRDRKLPDYEKSWQESYSVIRGRIDALRKLYPGTVFFSMPQARCMIELWKLQEAGRLPEVKGVAAPGGQHRRDYLIMDTLGHGGPLPTQMGTMLWLAVIYGVDVTEYDFDTGTNADLRPIVQQIIKDDPYARNGPAE
jgi:hypothetical protein